MVSSRTNVLTLPASTLGLAADSPVLQADPRQAAKLENWFPTPEGLRLRDGMVTHATVPSGIGALNVQQLMALDTQGSDYLVAAGSTTLWDATSDSTSPKLIGTGLASGDWSWCQFATTGGVFGIAVNGADFALILNPAITTYPMVPIGATRRLRFNGGMTVPFVTGGTVTGGTSGATGTVLGVIDNVSTEDQVFIGVETGAWTNGETVTGSLGGSGVLTNQQAITPATAPAITGIDTRALSDVWAHNRRLWFIERNSLNAWYLGIDSIGGPAVKFPLSGVFRRGGVLLFGSTFSSDSGAGLDDRIVFVTTEGEAAVYSITPDLVTISLEGVYYVGRPLSKRGKYHVGGDLVTLTDMGAVSLAMAVRTDASGLARVASTAAIMPFWEEWTSQATSLHKWSCLLDPTRQLILISLPADPSTGQPRCLAGNATTGAWSVYTGWAAGGLAILNGEAYMGASDRQAILHLHSGGMDVTDAYFGIVVPRFQDGANGLGHKIMASARIRYTSPEKRQFRLFGCADSRIPEAAVLPAAASIGTGAIWDSGFLWDGGATWGGAVARFSGFSDWQAVYGQGAQISAGVIIGSQSAGPPSVQVNTIEAVYEAGALI